MKLIDKLIIFVGIPEFFAGCVATKLVTFNTMETMVLSVMVCMAIVLYARVMVYHILTQYGVEDL